MRSGLGGHPIRNRYSIPWLCPVARQAREDPRIFRVPDTRSVVVYYIARCGRFHAINCGSAGLEDCIELIRDLNLFVH